MGRERGRRQPVHAPNERVRREHHDHDRTGPGEARRGPPASPGRRRRSERSVRDQERDRRCEERPGVGHAVQRDERRGRRYQERAAPAMEAANDREEGEWHPVRRQRIGVADRGRAERIERDERAGEPRRRHRPAELAHEHRGAEGAQDERRRDERVVIDDRIAQQDVDGQHDQGRREARVEEHERHPQRMEDVRVEEVEGIGQERVRRPGERPAGDQRVRAVARSRSAHRRQIARRQRRQERMQPNQREGREDDRRRGDESRPHAGAISQRGCTVDRRALTGGRRGR